MGFPSCARSQRPGKGTSQGEIGRGKARNETAAFPYFLKTVASNRCVTLSETLLRQRSGCRATFNNRRGRAVPKGAARVPDKLPNLIKLLRAKAPHRKYHAGGTIGGHPSSSIH